MVPLRSQSGFSLVELSIVLVILGLLVGGVLAGQSLIRAAELRAVSTEYSRWVTATQTFRDKYFALPGDMRNATAFWGTDNLGCPNGGGSSGTCNGDSDGLIEVFGFSGAPTSSNEIFRFWQQLAHAGLIEGTYQGIQSGAGANATVLGQNAPRSRLANAGWGIFPQGNTSADSRLYDMDYGQVLYFGAQVVNTVNVGAVLKPEEAWGIDTKIDDGRPSYGNVIALYWNNACAAANDGGHASSDLAASYKLNDSSNQCALAFKGFPG